MAGTGSERPAVRAGNPGGAVSCDAKCDAISADRVGLLARAVMLVAGLKIPESAREAVLARVIADRTAHRGAASPGQGSFSPQRREGEPDGGQGCAEPVGGGAFLLRYRLLGCTLSAAR